MKNILLTKSNNNLTNKNYWNNNWKETIIKNKELFFDVIKRFLKEDKNKKVFCLLSKSRCSL